MFSGNSTPALAGTSAGTSAGSSSSGSLFKSQAFLDYFKIFAIGILVETVRRMYSSFATFILGQFYLVANFESDDIAYGE